MYWSCGNTKKISIGDIFFLIKLGIEPKGIIGCGYVSSSPYPLPHWDDEKAMEGLTALRTDLLFKVLSETPIISIEQLQARYPSYNWSPQVVWSIGSRTHSQRTICPNTRKSGIWLFHPIRKRGPLIRRREKQDCHD